MFFTTCFRIAGLGIRLHTQEPIEVEPAFLPFLGREAPGDLVVRFLPADSVPDFSGPVLYENINFRVYEQNGTFIRLHRDPMKENVPFAWTVPGVPMEVRYLPAWASVFRSAYRCFSFLAFEERMMEHSRLILHASLVQTAFGGILFSGPSGIGKSTQAALWETLEGARQLNGDRPILEHRADGWFAHGSPYAGSSKCYRQECAPVRAIVLLGQAKSCSIHPLGAGEAFRALYGLTVMNVWNTVYVDTACCLLSELAAQVPIYRMVCTPDAAAVETVKAVLEKGGIL